VTRTLFLANLASTLFMTGVIWFVQIVHYPLFGAVGADGFAAYEQAHSARTTWVVLPPMLVEALTALLLVLHPDPAVPRGVAWAGLALVALIWLSTFFWQVPRHALLAGGFDPAAHRFLVLSNWARTAAWTARAVLLLAVASPRSPT